MYEAIKYLFPDILDSQFSLRDDSDGNGPYIAAWTYPQPQPTKSQIDAAAIKAAVPTVIYIRQAQRALYLAGYLSQVEAMIAAIPGAEGDLARIDWEKATEVRRSHPLVSAIAAQIPLTEDQLDNLFTLAATL